MKFNQFKMTQTTKAWKRTIDHETNGSRNDASSLLIGYFFACIAFSVVLIGIFTMIAGFLKEGGITLGIGIGLIALITIITDIIEGYHFALWEGFIDSVGGSLIFAAIFVIPTTIVGTFLSIILAAVL